ncbi:hypothetical protein VTO73DRAFT_11998 [Trametes versicolor]
MSSTSTDEAAEIAAYIAALEFNSVQLYCVASAIGKSAPPFALRQTSLTSLASAALLVYHYLTTLDLEYMHFWAKRRFGVAWALFLANRYLPLVAYIYQAPWWPVTFDPTTALEGRRTDSRYSIRCAAIVISQYILEFSQYALWGAIAYLRVHALGKSRALSILVLVLALVPVVFDIVLLTYMHPAIDPASGCLLDSSRVPFELYEMCVPGILASYYLDVLSYTAWVLSEAIVVGVTLAATRHHKSLAGALGRGERSLSAVLFRNGTIARWWCSAEERSLTNVIFHLVVSRTHLLRLIVNVISIVRPSSAINLVSSMLSFIAPLTSILLTRFYFDLQETAYPPSRSAGAALPGWSRTTGDLGFSAETHTLAFAGESASDSDGQTGSSTRSIPVGGSDVQGSPNVHAIELEMRISGQASEVGECGRAIP